MPRLVAVAKSQDEFDGIKSGSIRVGTELATPRKESPLIASNESWEDRASWLTFMTLGYLTPLLHKGTTTALQTEDLGTTRATDKAEACFERFDVSHMAEGPSSFFWHLYQKVWKDEVKHSTEKRPASVMRAQIRMVGKLNLAKALGFYFSGAALQFVPIGLLNVLVQHFSGTGYETLSDGALGAMTVALLILPVCASLCQTRHDVLMVHYGLQARTAVAVAIYRHSLNLTSAARQGVSTGEVVNLFSNDALKVELFMKFLAFMAVAPLQIGVCLYLIYTQVGNAMFVGLGFMIFLIPIQGFVFANLFVLQRKFITLTDKRVGLMNELLSGIRIVKFYAWEQAFSKLAAGMRRDEIVVLTKLAYVVAIGFSLVLLSAPVIQPVLIFATYVGGENQQLDAATAFTTIALFNLMRFPFAFMPMGFVQYQSCQVASARLSRFLMRKTLDDYVSNDVTPPPQAALPASASETTTAVVKKDINEKSPSSSSLVFSVRGASLGWGVAEPLMDAKTAKKFAKFGGGKGGKGGGKGGKGSGKGSKSEDAKKGKGVKGDGKGGKGSNNSNEKAEETTAAPPAAPAPVDPMCLKDLSFSIEEGSLVAIVGPVGSGKSSLLAALTGEMQLLSGSVSRAKSAGTVALAAQVPWVVNSTLRENVVFGAPFDAVRYANVLRACCLDADVTQLPAGDMTEIGEKGINLSGGQKARVALARAVYSDASVLLLDDPLSAVDAHVGQALFEGCIGNATVEEEDNEAEENDERSPKDIFATTVTTKKEKLPPPLLAGKTRLLVTHHVQYLRRCDQVIVLANGRMVASGSFDDLLAAEVPEVLEVVQAEKEREAAKEAEEEAAAAADEGGDGGSGGDGSGTLRTATVASNSNKKAQNANISGDKHGGQGKDGDLIIKEERAVGAVPLAAYAYYARAGGWRWVAALVVIALCGRGCEVGSTFWLAYWAEQSLDATNAYADGSDPEASNGLSRSRNSYFLNMYALLSLAGVVGLTCRSLCVATHRLSASQQIHQRLVASVLRAPVAFFDTTPMGRVLNRFAADIQTVDVEISQSVSQLVGSLTNCLGALVAISAATKGTFLLLLVPLAYLYFRVQRLFRLTSTEVERLSKISRSPIFADFSQTLAGAPAIRAYACGGRFKARAEAAMDTNNACVVAVQLCFSWLSIRLDAIGASILFFIVGLAVLFKGFVPAAWLGLALSFAVEMTTFLKHAVRMFAQSEGQMASVERLMQYTSGLDAEEPQHLVADQQRAIKANNALALTKKANKSSRSGASETSGAAAVPVVVDTSEWVPKWPRGGAVRFENVVMGYRPGLPDVLKGLSFACLEGEKVGVVGRTGSGKSSVMVSLFRFVELRSGVITVDGQDIKSLRLSQLRSSLSIIPQDPVMFSASLRFNLDPFEQHTDAELWEVIDKVELGPAVRALEGQLHEMVAEGGENFSVGQRQLLCIGRALLRKPKVLVLDEATASIDNATDAAVQLRIRQEFQDATVLTIAHRLHTIMDSDRVLVLEHGRVKEFDTPKALLEIGPAKGAFAAMVSATNAEAAHE